MSYTTCNTECLYIWETGIKEAVFIGSGIHYQENDPVHPQCLSLPLIYRVSRFCYKECTHNNAIIYSDNLDRQAVCYA